MAEATESARRHESEEWPAERGMTPFDFYLADLERRIIRDMDLTDPPDWRVYRGWLELRPTA